MKPDNSRVVRWPRRVVMLGLVIGLLAILATVAVQFLYKANLKPLSNDKTLIEIIVPKGYTDVQIGKLLEQKEIIRSGRVFSMYVSSKEARGSLQAGTYEFSPSQSVPEIVGQLTHGKIVTNLVTIFPGQRIDQIKRHLLQSGFSENSVNEALNPANYAGNAALVDKPVQASLEGYLYPDSFQRTSDTNPRSIVVASLKEMDKQLTPELRSAFAKQGLSTYEAITLASIVEKEVPHQEDRDKVAQVFYKRLRMGMKLESNVTSSYGAVIAGAKPSSKFPSVYNTYLHEGLPPTPVSNVSESSLRAVAYPASTDWLYFVAGDDGTTYFSKTFDDHEANVQKYCTTLCGR